MKNKQVQRHITYKSNSGLSYAPGLKGGTWSVG
jgi:hypothetical protein